MADTKGPLSVKIIAAPWGQNSHVFINGEESFDIRSFRLYSDVGEMTVLKLELVNVQVEVEGQVYLSEAPE